MNEKDARTNAICNVCTIAMHIDRIGLDILYAITIPASSFFGFSIFPNYKNAFFDHILHMESETVMQICVKSSTKNKQEVKLNTKLIY